MPDDAARLPRFPFVAAALCAACVGMAAWTWMRYSYCSDVTRPMARQLAERAIAPIGTNRLSRSIVGKWVALRGMRTSHWDEDEFSSEGELRFWHIPLISEGAGSYAKIPTRPEFDVAWHDLSGKVIWSPQRQQVFLGRVADNPFARSWIGSPLGAVDTTATRLTGASIAALVVGAMGVFVFTVALRHWLGERRASAAPAEDAPSG